jgi:hypothetical protein
LEATVEKTYASRYKGVVRTGNRAKPWRAWVKVDGRRQHLGVFESPEEATAARRAAISRMDRKSIRWISTVGCYDDNRDWFEIELTQDRWAKVDTCDMHLVYPGCWTWDGRYGIRMAGKQKIYMHRVILGTTSEVPEVDHINGDGTDNRRSNLRPATRTQDHANQRKTRGSSRYKGVFWDTTFKRWKARITINGRQLYLGSFDTEEAAARAYNVAALAAWGEYAWLNPVPALNVRPWKRDHGPRRRPREAVRR